MGGGTYRRVPRRRLFYGGVSGVSTGTGGTYLGPKERISVCSEGGGRNVPAGWFMNAVRREG